MNLLFSCIGKRGYIADLFRPHLTKGTDRIIGTSNTRWTAGFAACDVNFLLPDIEYAGYHDAVMQLCEDQSIRGVFSFFDPDVVRLAEIRDRLLQANIVPVLPAYETARICFDKFETFKFLRGHGFETPETSVDLDAVKQELEAGRLKFPLIVKPRSGFGSHHTHLARTPAELDVFFALGPAMVMQEFVCGEAYNFDICNDLERRPVAIVVWKKLRSTQGETEHVVTVKNERMLEVGVRLAQELGHVGPMDVDFFVNGDRLSIIEMNPRFGGGYPVSHLAGADLPGLTLKMIRGENIEPRLGQYRDNVAMVKTLNVVGGEQSRFWDEVMKLAGKSYRRSDEL